MRSARNGSKLGVSLRRDKMTAIDFVKGIAEGVGYEIIRRRNVFRDAGPLSVVFDVGANEGQTIYRVLEAAPNSTIHAFEPTRTASSLLSRRFSSSERIYLNQCALGPTAGTQEIKEGGATTMSSLL